MMSLVFFVAPAHANAPDVKVNVVVDNSGTIQPLGGVYLRWRNRCGGSYGHNCEYTDPAVPRRYATTGVDGTHLFEKFQTANTGVESATILPGFSDPDYPGDVHMMSPNGKAKFGCGQDDHKLAAMASGYVCDEYKVGPPTTKASDYTKLTCPNGWCEGALKFENDCTNGCPQKEYTFKCKGQSIGDMKEVKRSEVGLGSDDPKQADAQTWGYACSQTQFCNSATSTTPVPTSQKSNYASCDNFPSTASGAVKKKVKLTGMQSLYDKSYIQKQSEGINAYIVECINMAGKYTCTTGNAGMDTVVFGKSNVPAGYTLEMFKSSTGKVLTNPVTYQQLDEDIVAYSSYSTPISSFFMLVYPQQKQSAVNVGSSSGQQQATLSNSSDCRVVQDPYGHVYDAHTNEPLANASVELSKKDASGNYAKVTTGDTLVRIENPQTTKEDGSFSFNVIDGIYRLAAAKAEYISEISSDIIQAGKAVQVDLHLMPKDTAASEAFAKTNPIKIVQYLQSINKQTKEYVIEGQVSHPNAIITVYANIHSNILGYTNADNNGHFSVRFPLSKIMPGQYVAQLVATKKNYGLKDTVNLDPIFDSVKGYAYDSNGRLIPGAKVAVMLPFSTRPVFQTTADAKGYFRIPPSKLPPIAYSFVFTSLNGSADQMTTGGFLAQNMAHANTNRYVALNSDATGSVMGAYDTAGSPLSTGSDTVDSHSKVLVAAFVILLIMAIPLSRMYTERNGKRKKK